MSEEYVPMPVVPAFEAVNATSVRASLEFALDCLMRASNPNERLEKAVETALRLASRQELELAVHRDLEKARQRLGLYQYFLPETDT